MPTLSGVRVPRRRPRRALRRIDVSPPMEAPLPASTSIWERGMVLQTELNPSNRAFSMGKGMGAWEYKGKVGATHFFYIYTGSSFWLPLFLSVYLLYAFTCVMGTCSNEECGVVVWWWWWWWCGGGGVVVLWWCGGIVVGWWCGAGVVVVWWCCGGVVVVLWWCGAGGGGLSAPPPPPPGRP